MISWLNDQLTRSKRLIRSQSTIKIKRLDDAVLRDGTALCLLMEVMGGFEIFNLKLNPVSQVERLRNLNELLACLTRMNVPVFNFQPDEILHGNKCVIRNLIEVIATSANPNRRICGDVSTLKDSKNGSRELSVPSVRTKSEKSASRIQKAKLISISPDPIDLQCERRNGQIDSNQQVSTKLTSNNSSPYRSMLPSSSDPVIESNPRLPLMIRVEAINGTYQPLTTTTLSPNKPSSTTADDTFISHHPDVCQLQPGSSVESMTSHLGNHASLRDQSTQSTSIDVDPIPTIVESLAELTILRSQLLAVVQLDTNWAHAKNSHGKTGLIPLNYVQPADRFVGDSNLTYNYRWYHGRISRPESESILSGCRVGSFLVRDSDLYGGDLTLCVVGPAQNDATSSPGSTNVQHYRLIRERTSNNSTCKDLSHSPSKSKFLYTLDGQDWFDNLVTLIRSYCTHDCGLVSPLLFPIIDRHRDRIDQLRRSGWLINRDEVKIGDAIGKGEFGEVLKATYKGKSVAVKIYKKSAFRGALSYEASLMTRLKHPNLVTFIGIIHEQPGASPTCLVSEFIDHGSLLTFLHSKTRSELDNSTKLQFGIDICRGLAFLEANRVIHCDIAARNVLLASSSTSNNNDLPASSLIAKLTDFGMARDLKIEQQQQWDQDDFVKDGVPSPTSSSRQLLNDTRAVPVKWTAPEAVHSRIFSNKSDVWSFGILLWEIYSYGRIPYPRMMANQVLRYVASGGRMPSPSGCPPNLYQLMRRTWRLQPSQRPAFSQLLPQLIQLSKSREVSAGGDLDDINESAVNYTTDDAVDCYEQLVFDDSALPNSDAPRGNHDHVANALTLLNHPSSLSSTVHQSNKPAKGCQQQPNVPIMSRSFTTSSNGPSSTSSSNSTNGCGGNLGVVGHQGNNSSSINSRSTFCLPSSFDKLRI